MDAATLMTATKKSSGRSYRTLATMADVAASTITRIESRSTEPTFATMSRVLRSVGLELVAAWSPDPQQPHLAELASAWSEGDPGRAGVGPELHWTTWRALLDHLQLHPELIPEAIYTPVPPAGAPVIDALLAGVAEKLADDHGLPRPSWTESVPALHDTFSPPARRRRAVPAQLASRGVMIDAESLFRDPAGPGV